MSETINKMPISIFIWLITLSFSSGVLWMQVQNHKDLIEDQANMNSLVWDQLRSIQSDLSEIRGYLRAKEKQN